MTAPVSIFGCAFCSTTCTGSVREFWLIDSARDSETVTRLIRTILSPGDKTFVGALQRDVCSGLSDNAQAWLNAPGRNWGHNRGRTARGMGEMPAEQALLAAVA